MEKRGLILIVGSTGSGQIDHHRLDAGSPQREPLRHILTIEDPIEFCSSTRNRSSTSANWAWIRWTGQRCANAMRQAPDCILIGEIRDKETMQAAIAYAQTGHLCLGTLHANNSYHALNRIINFFPLETAPRSTSTCR